MTAIRRAAAEVGLDLDAILAGVDGVLADPLYWFPVRHHSPATARHLGDALRARMPKLVFIEGPSEANGLIGHLTDRRTEPPVAIYSSYRDDDNVLNLNGVLSPSPEIPLRLSSWYPLTSYSPEYVAIRTAAEIEARVVFIDLPQSALVRPFEDGEPKPKAPAPVPDEDRLITTSAFYRGLAAAAGFKSWDEAWDTLFEDPHEGDRERYRRELATFCAAARATADPGSEASEGTLERERHFLKVIRETMAAEGVGPEQAAVVCGGFHLFLDREDPTPPPAPPSGTVYVTVVPYSFFRVSELAGYGAGNRAPRFYQLCHDLTAAGRPDDVAMEHVIAVLRQLRGDGEATSTADAIATTHHARMLARLRGRRHVVLDDVDDALVTCGCKGNPVEEGRALRRAMDAVAIGRRIGKVTPAIGRLPIVVDFQFQLEELQLGAVLGDETRHRFRLDKREPMAARRSAFLHRLVFLGIPFATPAEGAGMLLGGTLFREDWHVKWEPRTEAALIEENLYGDTIESAALTRLREAIAGALLSAEATCERLLRAVDMDLPDLIGAAEDACGLAIDLDSSFVSLAAGLHSLSLLGRNAAFRGVRGDRLERIEARCYDRACFAIPGAATAPDEERERVVQGLLTVAEILQRSDRGRFDRDLFVESVRRAASDSPVPFLRGAFLGLLCELRDLSAEDLAARVGALARGRTEELVTAGDLLDGMFAVSRTSLLLGAEALVDAVDELLGAAEWNAFLEMLPRLRAAFERLNESQRDSFAATVARRFGLGTEADLRAMPAGLAATALVARIDAEVAATLAEWPL